VSGFERSQSQLPDATAAARTAALQRYDILDTERDIVFDGIAELAAALLDAPIAVVNFIADDRQFFKAEIGIGQRELPLDVSICRIALPERGLFVVPDLMGDDRFSCNPLVTVAEGLRFYAGMVLESDGVPIGTVCVLDTKPRPGGISDVQRRGLEALAVQAMAALERSAAAGRDRFKLALSEALLMLADANQIMSFTARMLGEFLGVAQVGFGIVEEAQEYATVAQEWNDGRMPKFAGRWRLDDFGPDRVALLKAGQTLRIDDIDAENRGERAVDAALNELAIRSALSVPLVRDKALVAVLFVYHPDARVWRADEIDLVEDCAARLWNGVMRARADELLMQSEAAARMQADQIAAIFNAAPVGLAVLDRDLRYVNINERLAEINGISVADHIGRTIREIVPDLYAQSVEAFNQVLAGKEIIGVEFIGETAAQPGVVRCWRSKWLPMRDATGEVSGVVLSAEEITNEKAAEEALKASEARLGRELERADIAQKAARAAFYEFDPQTGIGTPSPNLTELTGHAHQPTITLQWWQSLVHPSDLEMFSAAIEAAAQNGQDYAFEYRMRHRDGHWLWVSDRGRIDPARIDGQFHVIGMVMNIDEQRQAQLALAESEDRYRADLELQVKARTSELVGTNRKLQAEIKRREATQAALIQGQKLEALGQLTAGIAHDFNNILSAIAGGMDLIERRINDDKIKFITGHCKDAAFRGATLVKQMLAFSREEVLAPRSVNLARLSDEIAPLLKQAIPGNIVSFDFPAELPAVLIDPVLLETALLNLAVNARDAMPGGGTLSLTARVSHPRDRHHPAEFKAAEAVAIEVRDSGQGMPPEIVQRVTEPFFTTKAPGSGTGLGLAMVHGFIGQSGGAMHIDSRVGAGTTITLYLPLNTVAGDAMPVAALVTDTAAPTGVGAVLLVDDDAAVRAVAAEQLRDLGYTITEADGYAAAMTRIEAGEAFDCIVSDVVMPGGDGIALAAAIRATKPGLPILFMTGRADGKLVAGERVLHKPFKLTELATAVADVIALPVRERATVAKIASRSRSQCIADMLEHWDAGKFAGRVPGFATFDADICAEPHKLAVVSADASQLPMRFQVVSVGKDLEDLLGQSMADAEFDVRGADGFGSIEESYRRAVKTRLPVFDYMKMDFGDGGPEQFERLILPYSSDGGLVDRLVSVVVFGEHTQIEEQSYGAISNL
jgi:PAS domain S-box-containing protein